MTIPAWSDEIINVVLAQTWPAWMSRHPYLRHGWWSTALNGASLGTTVLASVIRNIGRPATIVEITEAASLVMTPRLLLVCLEEPIVSEWKYLIGDENIAIESSGVPWFDVLVTAERQCIIRSDGPKFWVAGPDVDAVPSFPSIEARTLVVLSWLGQREASKT
jgi:hypothetical protein